MTNLEELSAIYDAGTPGEWEYRPDEYDDWGVIKGPLREVGSYDPPFMLRGMIAQMRDPDRVAEKILSQHRKDGTDPWIANAKLTVALHNAFPAMNAELLALRAENERLRGVLADMANTINIVGSEYDQAVQSLDRLVLWVKRTARAALGSKP